MKSSRRSTQSAARQRQRPLDSNPGLGRGFSLGMSPHTRRGVVPSEAKPSRGTTKWSPGLARPSARASGFLAEGSRAKAREGAPRGQRTPQPAPPDLRRAYDASSLSVDPKLIEGVALFNRHQFFACHEVLEQRWLHTEGRSRDFYKGLIQAAVACYHWSKGNPAGALSLYQSSSRYLRKYRPVYLGVDVERFLQQYSELFGWLRRHRLHYEARLVPPLRWTQLPREFL